MTNRRRERASFCTDHIMESMLIDQHLTTATSYPSTLHRLLPLLGRRPALRRGRGLEIVLRPNKHGVPPSGEEQWLDESLPMRDGLYELSAGNVRWRSSRVRNCHLNKRTWAGALR